MPKAKSVRTCRLSAIPASWSESDVHEALKHHGLTVLGASPQLQRCPFGTETLTAIVTLDVTAEILRTLRENRLADRPLTWNEQSFVIDQHFLGLTVIASPSDVASEIAADVIAVHGLSGHAFGSWAYSDEQVQVMWLKDYLHTDIGNIRVLSYGYEARLDETTTMSRLTDYRRSFVAHLLNYRRGIETRPLIFFAHSFGGTLVAETITSLASKQEDDASQLLKSICALFFFAVPHKGLWSSELQQMTAERTEESKTKVLLDLSKDAESLRTMSETLADLSLNVQFVTIYEELQTAGVQKNTEKSSWESKGAPYTAVEESSAVLYLPNEKRIPAVADHRNIIKHKFRDQRYLMIKNELLRILKTAPEVVVQRFRTNSTPERSIAFYCLLSETILYSETVSLGRLVLDTRNPWEDFCATTPRPAESAIGITTNFYFRDILEQLGPQAEYVRLSRRLSTILQVENVQDALKSASEKTYVLTNARSWLKAICSSRQTREWLEQMFKAEFSVYLAVGIHVLSKLPVSSQEIVVALQYRRVTFDWLRPTDRDAVALAWDPSIWQPILITKGAKQHSEEGSELIRARLGTNIETNQLSDEENVLVSGWSIVI